MILDEMVKIRFKRYFRDQALWIFVGRVIEFTENWIKLDGKGIVLLIGSVHKPTSPIEIDDEQRTMIIPRENIAHIRVLPEDFNLNDIQIERKGFNYCIKIENGPDASLGERGETA